MKTNIPDRIGCPTCGSDHCERLGNSKDGRTFYRCGGCDTWFAVLFEIDARRSERSLIEASNSKHAAMMMDGEA